MVAYIRAAVLVAVVAVLLGAASAVAAPGDGCATASCRTQVREQIRAGWRAKVRPLRAWLRQVRYCESGSDGLYALTTTGNGFWFAYQFTPSTWHEVAGGRWTGPDHHKRPVGLWSKHPTALEQDYRAVRVLNKQGHKAWPICGGAR